MTMGTEEIADVRGVKVALDPEVMSENMLEVLRSGRYEWGEGRELPKVIQPGERIVELGGGVGFLGVLAQQTGMTESIAVYEANPGLIPLIEKTKQLNGADFEVNHRVVLPSTDGGKVPFYLRHDFWASSLAPEPFGYAEVVEVETVSWNDMIAKHRPTMLIADIEGGEGALFSDVDLTGINKVFIELHQRVLGRRGMKDIFDFFSSRDFHYDQWHSHGGVVLFSHVDRDRGPAHETRRRGRRKDS